jgi:hypothetical protein
MNLFFFLQFMSFWTFVASLCIYVCVRVCVGSMKLLFYVQISQIFIPINQWGVTINKV